RWCAALRLKRGQIGNVRKSEDDEDGRTIGISFDHLGREYKLVNIYAPNEVKEREDFFERMAATCCTECIIVGDFNVWEADASRRRLKEVMKTNGLIDVWRENNPRGWRGRREKRLQDFIKNYLARKRLISVGEDGG
uniref:Endonuclease/exonuclease/phosphatase domain-containing protein n=1 Tax=Gasterosteus aculeatus aculeatus TaxID=481459 RepID=A0AAQ4QI72_GASAC